MTRFSMALPGFREAGGTQQAQAFENYLRLRIPIFRSFCLASMRAQSEPPARWLIGFSPETRAQVEPLIEELKGEDWIVPVWQDTSGGVPERARRTFARAIRSLIGPEHRFVLSTRLDNDDAIAIRYGEAALSYAAAVLADRPDADDFWISFPIGAQFDGRRCSLFTLTNSPFLTRCESVERFLGGAGGTAYEGNHLRVFERGMVHLPITRGPMWLQVVHSSNVINGSKRLTAFRRGEAVLRSFGVDRDSVQHMF
ncbi:glycosyltransferase [Methylopila sp. M107]|uniref:glycosyltransferase n=1 Tax=Methylopila sp. M107 TaxID=1101190 RepID=UPI0018C9B6C1|nr:glycosyltransferase [Methylopila sp. M107]